MSFFELIGLSFVQGLTEFLPVSSSGHLILFSKFFALKDEGIGIDIALHIGSLFAVIIYFKSDIFQMVRDVFKSKFLPDFKVFFNKQAYLLLIASVPALIVGFWLRNFGTDFLRNPKIIGSTILFYGIVLYVADKFSKAKKTLKEMGIKEALLIGLAQCLALIPGTSRSGITITAARFLKINRVDAAKFSMLLSVPVIFAAGALEFYRLIVASQNMALIFSLESIVLSFAFSYFAIFFMMQWLKKWTYLPFVIYRVILGLILIFLF